jgi:hypothetical protein
MPSLLATSRTTLIETGCLDHEVVKVCSGNLTTRLFYMSVQNLPTSFNGIVKLQELSDKTN